MTGRIVRSADFERVLGSAPRARSPHFAVHHVASMPSRAMHKPSERKLSTGSNPTIVHHVDDSATSAEPAPAAAVVAGQWLGTVVPKRHARRSVTRTLLKRQIKAAWQRHDRLPDGLWVVRLRAPFARDRFPSAASDALALAAREELDAMLAGLLHRLARA